MDSINITAQMNAVTQVIPLSHGLIIAATLFCIGLFGVMARRDLLFMLIGLELMMNATALAFVMVGSAFQQADGQVMLIFILTLAAAEVAIGLAMLIRFYHQRNSLDIDKINKGASK